MATILFWGNSTRLKEDLNLELSARGHSLVIPFDRDELQSTFGSGTIDIACFEVSDTASVADLQQALSLPDLPEVILMMTDNFHLIDNIDVTSVWDVVAGESNISHLVDTIGQAWQYKVAKNLKNKKLTLKRDSIIGASRKLEDCLALASTCAMTDAPVLITGETGTGKELFAHVVHMNSHRAAGKFVVVDCTSLSEGLIESILFGHERGVFTGASTYRDGLIKIADGGTLFLDEVGELSLKIQKSFLRVLQEKKFRTLGSKTESESNFRLIAATNRNLDEMCDNGLFRSDLLFRLRSVHLKLPPLRERREDIPAIVQSHIKRLCDKYAICQKEITRECYTYLNEHDWPGNVRELVNIIEYIVSNAREEELIYPKHLPKELRSNILKAILDKKSAPAARTALPVTPDLPAQPVRAGQPVQADPYAPPSPLNNGKPKSFKDARRIGVDNLEYQYLHSLLAWCNYNIDQACELSELSRSRLYGLLKKHSISSKAKAQTN